MKEGRSWVDTGLEVSKKVDVAGMVVGTAMIVFGSVSAGVMLAGFSGVTYFAANEMQKRRK
jgi:hypothetical protein